MSQVEATMYQTRNQEYAASILILPMRIYCWVHLKLMNFVMWKITRRKNSYTQGLIRYWIMRFLTVCPTEAGSENLLVTLIFVYIWLSLLNETLSNTPSRVTPIHLILTDESFGSDRYQPILISFCSAMDKAF